MAGARNSCSLISVLTREKCLVTLRNVSAAPIACGCLALLFHVVLLHAQSRQNAPLPITHEQAPRNVLRSDVKLALVNVSVSDPFDDSVVGLEQENFRVLEDGIEQEVISFSSEDVPISVGIIADVSGSMKGDIQGVRAFLVGFGQSNRAYSISIAVVACSSRLIFWRR